MADEKAECKHGLNKEWCGFCKPAKGMVEFSATKFATKYPTLSSAELTTKALDVITPAARMKLLSSLLKAQFDRVRREEVRSVEKAASLHEYEQERVERTRESQRRRSSERRTRENEASVSNTPWRYPLTKAYTRWEHKPIWSKDKELRDNDPEYLAYLRTRGEGFFGYSYASFRVGRAFKEFENTTRQKVRLELTEELLGSSFSVGEGRTVLWGKATVGDHMLRIESLLTQAGGSVATANRHKAAMSLLHQYNVPTLNEVKNIKEAA